MTKARDLANLISGGLTASEIPDLPASKITSGTLASARLSLSASDIPNLDTAKITSGTFADARLSSSSVTQHVDLSNLSASNLTSGTVPSARLSLSASDVPDLATSKITSGTFADARLSSSSVTQHVDLTALSASNLTSGTIPNARYGTPTFNGSNITNLSTTTTTGTWTPGFSHGSFTDKSGHYQKVGKFVFCQCEARATSNPYNGGNPGNSNEHFTMSGLPFTAESISSGHTAWLIAMGVFYSRDQPFGSRFTVYVKDNTTSWGLHQDQGYRATKYFDDVGGYGGLRVYDMRNVYHSGDSEESWIYAKFMYVANS